MVVSVAIHPEQNDMMVSCSEDGCVIMWDLRMPKPALGTCADGFPIKTLNLYLTKICILIQVFPGNSLQIVPLASRLLIAVESIS